MSGTRQSKPWRPSWRVPPGDILQEMMDERGLTPETLAKHMRVPLARLRAVLADECAIDDALADALQTAFGVTAVFWHNLEQLNPRDRR